MKMTLPTKQLILLLVILAAWVASSISSASEVSFPNNPTVGHCSEVMGADSHKTEISHCQPPTQLLSSTNYIDTKFDTDKISNPNNDLYRYMLYQRLKKPPRTSFYSLSISNPSVS